MLYFYTLWTVAGICVLPFNKRAVCRSEIIELTLIITKVKSQLHLAQRTAGVFIKTLVLDKSVNEAGIFWHTIESYGYWIMPS